MTDGDDDNVYLFISTTSSAVDDDDNDGSRRHDDDNVNGENAARSDCRHGQRGLNGKDAGTLT